MNQQHSGMLVLEANERYFKGRPYLDRVEFVFSEQAGEMNGFTIQEKQTSPEQQTVFDERHVQYLSLNLKKEGASSAPKL